MNTAIYGDICKGLEDYLSNSQFNPFVVRDSPSLKPRYPCVVVREISNQYKSSALGGYDQQTTLGYEIDIYAKQVGQSADIEVARELQGLVDEFLTIKCKMRRMTATPNNNFDQLYYRIVMRYVTTLDEQRLRLY